MTTRHTIGQSVAAVWFVLSTLIGLIFDDPTTQTRLIILAGVVAVALYAVLARFAVPSEAVRRQTQARNRERG